MLQYLHTNFDLDSDKLVEVLDELPLWSAPFGLKLLDKIKYNNLTKVLDIGFGAGFPLTEIAMRLGKNAKIYGIDPWSAAVKRAKKKIERYGIENIEIIDGVAENIPLETGSIDLIVSNNGINNVHDLNQVLNECSRIAKSGAQFVQTVNLDGTMLEFYTVLENVCSDFGLSESIEKMRQHIFTKRKPLDYFIGLLENNGFKTKDIEHAQFDYKFADGTAMLNHFFIRVAFLGAWKEIVHPDKQEIVFCEIEKRINEQSKSRGYFQLSVPFVVINSEKE